jgi:hypothetical protein
MLIRRTSGVISVWYVAFSARIPNPLWNWLIPGKWKHVSAFGFCEEANTWLFLDPEFTGTKAYIVVPHEVDRYISAAMAEGAILCMPASKLSGANIRSVSCCTMTIRHLLGIRGWSPWSAIPDCLYADCLAAGAVVVPPCVELGAK